MPFVCCVPGCKIRYNADEKVSLFRFPKNEDFREKWLRYIHRDGYQICDSSRVCIKHFSERFIIREDVMTKPDGTILRVARDQLKLSLDAFPTIFENQPSYMSTVLPPKRKAPSVRHAEYKIRRENEEEAKKKLDEIINFEELSSNISKKICIFLDYFSLKLYKEKIIIFALDEGAELPSIVKGIIVYKDLKITSFYKNIEIDNNDLNDILGKTKRCATWSVLLNVLEFVKNYNIPDINSGFKVITKILKELAKDPMYDENINKIKFICEQIELLNSKKIIYSTDTLIWASTIFFTFPGAYCLLQQSKILTLPSPRHLKRLLLKVGSNTSGIEESHINYLTEKRKLLNDKEKSVILMLDEIYVKSEVSYKSGKIEGFALRSTTNDDKMVATTIQAFMISSIFSHYKDIVGLFPISTLKHNLLLELTLEVLKNLTNIGYQVIAIISDNNSVNKKMFDLLCGGRMNTYFFNPFSDEEQKIFVFFDTVHLFKSIRNIWFNQKDTFQTFYFPEIPDDMQKCQLFPDPQMNELILHKASVNDLKKIFLEEERNIIKLAPSLSRKVLYPSSIERQNVKLCIRLFDNKNVTALEEVHKNNLHLVKGTVTFLNLISKWWKIVNVKSQFKGVRFRDTHYDAIKSPDCDKNIVFFKNFLRWLELWNDLTIPGEPNTSRNGKLSTHTQFSLTHTCKAFIDMCNYLLIDLKFDYVLLGKFQTDNLEGRFGQYRLMSGGNYHISVTQVLESERKLKLLSFLKLQSSVKGDFIINNLLSNCKENVIMDTEPGRQFDDNFLDVLILSNEESINDQDTRILIYIAGYIGRVVNKKLKCKNCADFTCFETNLDIEPSIENNEFSYIQSLDRGGLKWPKDIIVQTITNVFLLFKVLISEGFEQYFLKLKNQRSALQTMSMEMLKYKNMLSPSTTCDVCGIIRTRLFELWVIHFSNILLNNYCKMENSMEQYKKTTKTKKQRTVKKLSSK